MAGIPRETVTTTLLLVGIGLALVGAVMFFAFRILNQSGGGSLGGGFGQPTQSPVNFPATPTPEFIPNQPLVNGS